MSDSATDTTVTTRAGGERSRRSLPVRIVLWVLQVVLAISFLFAGGLKLAGGQDMVDLFDSIGVGQWLRYVVGALEVAGAVGLLVAPLAGLAALGLVALMVGATITNLFVVDDSPVVPVVYLVIAAVIAWGRWPSVTALAGRFRRGGTRS